MLQSVRLRSSMLAVVASCAILGASGCQTDEKSVGMLLGAGVGALAGSQFGSGSGQILATVAGAAAGAWLGGQLAQYLSERDEKRLAEATQTTAVTGQTQTWTGGDSVASGRTRVVGTGTRQASEAVPVLKARVKEVPPFQYVGEKYRSLATGNVRGGPGTDYQVVDKIASGETVDVVGKVDGKPWYMIGDGGVGTGFVHADLLTATGRPAESMVATAASPEVAAARTSVTSECRDIEQIIVLGDGSEKTETVRACRGPDGWSVV